MEQITRKAYAKINLGLDVLRRREDGYHEVKMIMQTVDIFDTLTFVKKDTPGIRLKVDNAELSEDKDNLIANSACDDKNYWKDTTGFEPVQYLC